MSSKKVLIFDAGSTGTRVYLYQYTDPYNTSTYSAVLDESGAPRKKSCEIRLADAADNETIIDSIYNELLTNNANNWIPESERSDVDLILFGTAGMRELSKDNQTKVMNLAYEKAKSGFVYNSKKENFKVITGDDEGIYAWISVNRLRNAFSSNVPTIPIFEFGGASAQFAMEVKSDKGSYANDFTYQVKVGSSHHSVFTHSWLGYGIEASAPIVHKELMKNTTESPCVIKDATLKLKIDGTKVSFTGKPDYDKCYQLLSNYLMKKSEDCKGLPCIFKDNTKDKCVPLPQNFTDIFGIELMNEIAEYLKLGNPTNLSALKEKTKWFETLTYQQAKDYDPSYEYIEWQFFGEVLLINFLERGFEGFANDIKIDAPAKINGTKPQWTLGAVLEIYSAVEIKPKLPTKVIIGIVVGSVVFVAASVGIGVWIYFYCKKRAAKRIVVGDTQLM